MKGKKLITVLLIFGVIFSVSSIAFERRSSVFRSEYPYGSALEWNVQYGFPLSFLAVNYKRTVLAWLGRDPSWDRLYGLDVEDYELLTQQYFNPQIEHYTFEYTFFLDVVFWFSVVLIGFKILKLQEVDVKGKLRKIYQNDRDDRTK